MAESLNKVTHGSLMEKVIFEQWAEEDGGKIFFSNLRSNPCIDAEVESVGCGADNN